MVVSSGKLLKKVVDDVLDFNKFISGNAEIEIQRTDLQETMNNILNSIALSPITEKKSITFRSFYDQQTSLVARVDTFDSKTYRYVSTMLVEDYVSLGELRFPGRFVFLGPDGEPQRAWIMRDVALNPEVPDERFEAP